MADCKLKSNLLYEEAEWLPRRKSERRFKKNKNMKFMKFSFKKIGSILASTAMLSSTVALAAAANFPTPFVKGGAADVAIVYGGADAAYTDIVAAADITSFLSTKLAEQTTTGSGGSTGTVTGEAAPLFSSGTKLYINDTINTVKSVLTKSELATVLQDGSFSGNVDATYTQTLVIGSNPRVTFARHPNNDKDPSYGLALSTSTSNYIYNATVSFNKAVNFTHADSKGQTISLFGQSFTVGSATSGTDLVLLKSAEKVALTNEDPSKEITIGGKSYTVELVSASDTAATIKVTSSDGSSDTKTISEAASKKINGLTVAVDTADETNFALSASIIAGAEKITLVSGSSISVGDEGTSIDGTLVTFTNSPADMTKFVVSVAAKDSDHGAIIPGEALIDPVFGSFKIDFAGLSTSDDSTAREVIKVANSGDDKIQLTMTDMRGNEKTVQWAMNLTSHLGLYADSDARNISIFERAPNYRNEYMVVGNEDEGRLLKVTQITNSTTGYSSDKVKFTDVFSGDIYEASLSAEGTGTVTIGGKVYDLNYYGASTASEDTRSVRLNYPDSSGGAAAVIYPTISTSKGAKVSFYKPVVINLTNWDGAAASLTTLRLPDGDGYTDVTFGGIGTDEAGTSFNVTCGSTTTRMALNITGVADTENIGCTIGRLTYNITAIDGNTTLIKLNNPSTGAAIGAAGTNGASSSPQYPALVVFEEKDDNSNYEALVVTLDPGTSASNGLDVSDVARTWLTATTSSTTSFRNTMATDSDITKEADLFGTIVSLDSNSAGHKTATISYPGDQVYVQAYGGSISSAIDTGATSSGGSGKALGSVVVADTEASSVSGKNLVVVGGSCVNSVAADLLGVSSPTCSADFTAKTGVGSGQYLIETFSRTGGKVATLVAGYNAGDTTNAAKALTTQAIDTTAGKKYTGTTSTDVSASMTA